ncbi:hypothetical protein L1785_18710 [Antribacter sp. KLBMP9083]|uniref:Uncharacterized protein n=1 Tax=Antribacter soli TaxID=2910976 RepID=A0AA41QH56_9MICO|nr:hypothetical protein [Antribacter soli]MCF4123011.1 hypothetical protein [Antribacter soli]
MTSAERNTDLEVTYKGEAVANSQVTTITLTAKGGLDIGPANFETGGTLNLALDRAKLLAVTGD